MRITDPQLTEQLIDAIATQGYCVCDNFIQADLIDGLIALALSQHQQQLTHQAGTGKQAHLVPEIRNDFVIWLEQDDTNAFVQSYWQIMQDIKQTVNQSLFLNLRDLEAHLAVYLAGGFYKAHLDQFTSSTSATSRVSSFTGEPAMKRVLSSIVYLNKDWPEDAGGQLRLYTTPNEKPTNAEAPYLDIEPFAGRFVIFDSSRFWHEVLPAKQVRLSLTGWFRAPN